MTRYNARKDLNHDEVMDALRDEGYTVLDTHDYGDGFPDLVVAAGGFWMFVEVKQPGKTLTPKEKQMSQNAKIAQAPYIVAYGGSDAIKKVYLWLKRMRGVTGGETYRQRYLNLMELMRKRAAEIVNLQAEIKALQDLRKKERSE